MSGWIFVAIGIFLAAVGSFLVYYGQNLLRTSSTLSPAGQTGGAQVLRVLSPQQERLLRVIHKYQVDFGADKLVIAAEALGAGADPAARNREFEILMNGLPLEYLRQLPEMRLGSPFVVTITDAGIGYLKSN